MQIMESDKSVYYTFKYLPLVAGIVMGLCPLLAHLNPENSTFNGEPGPPDFWTTIIFVLIGLLFVLISILVISKLVIVEMNNQNLKIKKGNKVIQVSWLDVDSVSMVPTVFPPLYKLRLKNYEDYFLFNTTRSGAQLMVFTCDWSDMGGLIKKKKGELGI